MQYQAGYFFNSIFDLFINQTVRDKAEKIVFQLSHFDLTCSAELKHKKVEYISEIKTVQNLLQRGFPTIPSVFIEDLFCTTFGINTRKLDAMNQISHPFNEDILADDLYKAIHVIDPRITLASQTETLEEESKATGKKGIRFNFKYAYFPEYLGHSFLQLIEENRTFDTMVVSSGTDEHEKLRKEYNQIIGRKQEYVLEMPYAVQGEKGIAIELDDTPSETKYEYEIDQLKQGLCKQIGWAKPLNIETYHPGDINTQLRPLIDFTYKEYFDIIAKNFRSPLYKKTNGLISLQFALTPVAIARIQKTILECLLSGILSLNDETWKIGVIERDVPCAHLALQDLKLHFDNLFALKGEEKRFPDIRLSIYHTDEFKDAQLNTIYPGEIKNLKDFDEQAEFDLLIDISVLMRSDLIYPLVNTSAQQVATIRSVRSVSAKYKILTDRNISYLDFYSSKSDEETKDKAKASLKYFLRNIFRKDGFLPGQLELINNMLQQRNTLGLLPPNGGKNLAALLAAFLQPGVCFMVSHNHYLADHHLKSLLNLKTDKIQVFNNLIEFIGKIDQHHIKLENAGVQFAFIDPSFVRKKEFRDVLIGMEFNKVFINYLIIDEAHCLSEWGHDFSPQYHNLGILKDQIFKNPVRQTVPLVALTGTAGYSCVSDIKRELQIKDKDVVTSTIKLSDISFKVLDTTSNQIKPDMDVSQIRQTVELRKQANLSLLINEIFPEQGSSQIRQDTVIFYSSKQRTIGVIDTEDRLSDKLTNAFGKLKIGSFSGKKISDTEQITIQEVVKSLQNTDKFQDDELDILVSTSVAGIGISKPDIRNILYFSMPSSIEAFIQQTYRAGVDGQKSTCSVLLDKQAFSIPKTLNIGQYLHENKTIFDKYLAYEELISKYKGKLKEINVLQQLWNGFIPDPVNYADIISMQIEEAFGIGIDLVFQPEKKTKRIYIYSGEKTFGYIDLAGLSINSSESTFEKGLSEEILSFAEKQINKRAIEGEELQKTLCNPLYDGKSICLAKAFDDMSPGSYTEITIPYTNDGIEQLYKYLKENHSNTLSKRMVLRIYQESLSETDFTDKIEKIKPFETESKHKEEIKKIFGQTWTKNECHLAIYRLSRIGMIEDYLVDENKQQFIIKIRKQDEQRYLNELFAMFDEFLMPENAAKEKKMWTEKINVYQMLLSSVDFFYQYVLPYQINSVETLHLIFSQVPDNKINKNEVNLSIKELMDRYFYAKWANSYFTLIPGTKPLMDKQQDFTMIKSYLSHLGALKENWQHLRKSNEMIIRENPDLYLPYLLNAYASLIGGEQNEELIDEAIDQIARGFIKMRKQKNYDRDNYQTNIQAFLDLLYQNRPDLKESYGEILWLRMHYIWLKDFNTKIS